MICEEEDEPEEEEEKCDVRGCKRKVTIIFPLLHPPVQLCNYHHSNPHNERLKRIIADSNAPPDDFDIPDDFEGDEYLYD